MAGLTTDGVGEGEFTAASPYGITGIAAVGHPGGVTNCPGLGAGLTAYRRMGAVTSEIFLSPYGVGCRFHSR